MIWLVLVLLAFGPVGAIWFVLNLPTVFEVLERVWLTLRRLVRRRTPDAPAEMSVQRIAADLRRINAYLDSLERSNAPARAARLKAAVLAYDDVLVLACRTLEIPAPDSTPLEPVDRLQTEAALAQHGLVW